LSLSGGRLGGNPGRGNFSNLAARGPAPATPAAGRGNAPNLAGAMAALREPPANQFSFIFETGQHEMDGKGIPETSEWATKLGCGARVRKADVADTKPGYVYDTRRQDPGSDAWGRTPKGGSAEIFEYQHCSGGRIVADVIRENKKDTEGVEPHTNQKLIKIMISPKPTKRAP